MVKFDISDQMLLKARNKAVDMGLIRNSIEKGAGSLGGFVGEFIAQKALGGKVCNTYDYDLVTENNSKIDVKTKMTAVEPRLDYDCSISDFNTKQDCDFYAFVRVKTDFSCGWFLGWIQKEDYFKRARFLKKGEQDGNNGFIVKADCYNLRIDQLDDSINES